MKWKKLILSYINIACTAKYNNSLFNNNLEYNSLNSNVSIKRKYQDVNSHKPIKNNNSKKKKSNSSSDSIIAKLNDADFYFGNLNKNAYDLNNRNVKFNNLSSIPNNTFDNEISNFENQSYSILNDPNDYIFEDKNHGSPSNNLTDYEIVELANFINENTDSNLNLCYDNIENNNTSSLFTNNTETVKSTQSVNKLQTNSCKLQFHNNINALNENLNYIHNCINNNEFSQQLMKFINFVLLNKQELSRWIKNSVCNYEKGKYDNIINTNTKHHKFAMFKLISDNMLVFHSIIENYKDSITCEDFFDNSKNNHKNITINDKAKKYKNKSKELNLLYFYCTDYNNFMMQHTMDELLTNIQNMKYIKIKHLRPFLQKLSSLTFYKNIFHLQYLQSNHERFVKFFSLISNVSTYFDTHYLHLQKYFILFNVSNNNKICFSNLCDKQHSLYYYILDWILYFIFNHHFNFCHYKFDLIKINIPLDLNSPFINLLTLMYAIVKNNDVVNSKLDNNDFMNNWKSDIANNLNHLYNLVNFNTNENKIYEFYDKNNIDFLNKLNKKNKIWLILSKLKTENDYTIEIISIIFEMYTCVNNAFLNILNVGNYNK